MRKFDKKQRNTHKRNPKPVIAIVTEGENVTETQYFNSFNTQHSGCIIKIVRAGGKTDPEKLLAQLDNYWKSNDLDSTLGDKGFVVLDLDCDYNKAAIIRNLKNSTDYDFIVSNPCFEVWFILHFIYSTHAFSGNNEVLKTLEKYISDYSKTKNVFSQLEDKMGNAIANSDRIAEYFDSMQMQWPSEECNPRTDVGMLVELILQKSNRDNLKNE